MRFLALLLFAATANAACPPGALEQPIPGGTICIFNDVDCDTRLSRRVCENGACRCEPIPPVVLACQISVVYDPRDPSKAWAIEPAASCDPAGSDLALAAILAKRLGYK